jgi:hypothetical protein
VKCPLKGRESTLWATVEAGRLPEYYALQALRQLMVTNGDITDLFVFDGTEGAIFPVAADPSTWSQIHSAWDEIMRYVKDAQALPLTDRDTRVRDDAEWLRAAAAYLEAKRAVDAVGTVFDDAKTQLTRLASHAREEGGGVAVMRFWKVAVEYKRVPELAGVDLAQYRGPAREETRVAIKD